MAKDLQFLVKSIQLLAEKKSNPVIEVIPQDKPLLENKKYPESGLLEFNQSGWRAYYHCHPASRQGDHHFEGEHGHFHLFTKISDDAWSHLAALAMDPFGQPLGWFTVNQWVTGEAWGNINVLKERLSNISCSSQDSLVETWLLCFTQLASDKIIQLLVKREQAVESLNKKINVDIKNDRSIYLLSKINCTFNDLIGQELTKQELS